MAGFSAENIKHWITPQGIMYGINIAYLMDMDHLMFHDRLYKYYHDLNSTHSCNEPLMYWRDSSTGDMVHMNGDFPHCMDVVIRNCGAPTYGIEAKHLDDLYAVFTDKKEIVDILKHAFELHSIGE